MQRDYPCPRCNMDEGSPICLQDERCTGAVPPMTVDDFFAEAKRLNLRMLGTPEEIRAALDAKDAEIARLTGMDDAMRAEWDRECGDTDKILRALGLDPANCRTDGGSLKLQMVLGAIEHRDVMLKREARRAAKGLTVQADSDGAWLAFASSTGLHALLNVEHIADSYGGIVSKAIRDWAADVSAAACPSGKCTDPARDCYGSGCLSDEPQSAVAAAHGGLTQTAQG